MTLDLTQAFDKVLGDTLWIVSTDCDDATAFYLNGEFWTEIDTNDDYEIPKILYHLMVKYTFGTIVEIQLSDKGYALYEEDDCQYRKYLSDYSEGHFNWKYQVVHQRENA